VIPTEQAAAAAAAVWPLPLWQQPFLQAAEYCASSHQTLACSSELLQQHNPFLTSSTENQPARIDFNWITWPTGFQL
jgi:hypothetical protein